MNLYLDDLRFVLKIYYIYFILEQQKKKKFLNFTVQFNADLYLSFKEKN